MCVCMCVCVCGWRGKEQERHHLNITAAPCTHLGACRCKRYSPSLMRTLHRRWRSCERSDRPTSSTRRQRQRLTFSHASSLPGAFSALRLESRARVCMCVCACELSTRMHTYTHTGGDTNPEACLQHTLPPHSPSPPPMCRRNSAPPQRPSLLRRRH